MEAKTFEHLPLPAHIFTAHGHLWKHGPAAADTETSSHPRGSTNSNRPLETLPGRHLGIPSIGNGSEPPPLERHISLLAKRTILAGTHRSVFLLLSFCFCFFFCISSAAPTADAAQCHREGDQRLLQQATCTQRLTGITAHTGSCLGKKFP